MQVADVKWRVVFSEELPEAPASGPDTYADVRASEIMAKGSKISPSGTELDGAQKRFYCHTRNDGHTAKPIVAYAKPGSPRNEREWEVPEPRFDLVTGKLSSSGEITKCDGAVVLLDPGDSGLWILSVWHTNNPSGTRVMAFLEGRMEGVAVPRQLPIIREVSVAPVYKGGVCGPRALDFFLPNHPITRWQTIVVLMRFATWLFRELRRAFKIPIEQLPDPSPGTTEQVFEDVKKEDAAWASTAWAQKIGLISGYKCEPPAE